MHDGQQLGAQVVVQVAGDALAFLLGDLLDPQLGHLRVVALHLGGGFGHAALERVAGGLGGLQRAAERRP